MCGIVGYVGKRREAKFLIEKLEMLEYRGYDSAGYTNLSDGKFETKKQVGKIERLKKEIDENAKIECAIAHTRWATHGKVNLKNTHPHFSSSESWALVHNGIIENFKELSLGIGFESDSDTAVAVELLEKREAKTIQDLIKVFNEIKGSFGICAVNKNLPNTLFLAKRKSPLYVSKNESGEFLVASDPICFKDFSNKYYVLEDDEFAKVSLNKIEFFDKFGKVFQKEEIPLSEMVYSFGKRAFSTFMMKEIFEEEEALKRQVETYKSTGILDRFDKKFLDRFKEVVFIACGTAYHAGLIGARYFEKILHIRSRAEQASEIIYKTPVFLDGQTLCIFVSQSGETADTLSALELAKKKGAVCLSLTNVPYSTLAKKSDIVLPVCAGIEVAVASTKAYVCQLSALYIFACHLYNLKNAKNINFYEKILNISNNLLNFDKKQINNLAKILQDKTECIFIGKDLDFITAEEASLKLKETTYIASQVYPSGELKHGYLAQVEEGTVLISLASQKDMRVKTINSTSEAEARGARAFIFTNDKKFKDSERAVYFDEEDELMLVILMIVPLQYLACKICELKGIDPDKPRNLAKSVTVE